MSNGTLAHVPSAAERAVFLDKDGTLIENVPYNVDPELVELSPGAGPSLRQLVDRGFRLVVISNQSGVADGRFDAAALIPVERRIDALLAPSGIAIDAFYYCTHSAAQQCDCRKPAPGLLLRAAEAHGIDLTASWLIGDILDDVEAGSRAGCRTALLITGNETLWQPGRYRVPDVAGRSFRDIVGAIVATESSTRRPSGVKHAVPVGRRC